MWTAVVPPVAHLLSSVLVGFYVFGWERVAKSLQLSASSAIPPADVEKVMQIYGLTTLAPIIVGIGVLAVGHGLRNLIIWIGTRLPIHLTSVTTSQMRAAVDEWTLRRLWALHPEFDPIQLLNMLHVTTDEAIAQAEGNAHAHHRFRAVVGLRDRMRFHEDQLRFTKGLVVTAAILGAMLSAVRGELLPLLRVFVVAALGLGWFAYQAIRLIETEHFYFKAKIQTYLEVEESKRASQILPDVATVERDERRLQELDGCLMLTPIWTLEWSLSDKPIGRQQLMKAVRQAWKRVRSHQSTPGK